MTPGPGRALCRGLGGDSGFDFVSGRCVLGHRNLGALCEAGGDGHRAHPISSCRLSVCRLLVYHPWACHLSVYHLSAAHRVAPNQARSSEYTYPHPCRLYQHFHPLATSTGGDHDPGPCRDLYIHADDLISTHQPHLPKSEKTEDNPAAVTYRRGVNVTTQVSDRLDVVDSSEEHTRSYDEVRHFDGICSCLRNCRRLRMVCYLRLQARRLRRTLLVPGVDLVLVLLSSDDPIRVTLRMLVGRQDSQEEGFR